MIRTICICIRSLVRIATYIYVVFLHFTNICITKIIGLKILLYHRMNSVSERATVVRLTAEDLETLCNVITLHLNASLYEDLISNLTTNSRVFQHVASAIAKNMEKSISETQRTIAKNALKEMSSALEAARYDHQKLTDEVRDLSNALKELAAQIRHNIFEDLSE